MRKSTDQELIAHVQRLAKDLRTSELELLLYLNEMQQRLLYALLGYASLFAYCLAKLNFSESTTCRRLAAARVLARFADAGEFLADGRLHVTALAMLEKHLTPENWQPVLAKAAGKTKSELEWLIAELAPRPDVPTSIKRLPSKEPELPAELNLEAAPDAPKSSSAERRADSQQKVVSVVQPLTAERVMIKCSADAALAAKIKRAGELLAHKFPRGELEHILDAALEALLEDIAPERKVMRQEKRQQAKAAAANKKSSSGKQDVSNAAAAQKFSTTVEVNMTATYESSAERSVESSAESADESSSSAPKAGSRYIPAEAKRAAWQECQGRCAYVSPEGRRCTERRALEFDHVRPVALGGGSSTDNIRCYCRSHNAFAAFKTYGPHQPWRNRAVQSASR